MPGCGEGRFGGRRCNPRLVALDIGGLFFCAHTGGAFIEGFAFGLLAFEHPADLALLAQVFHAHALPLIEFITVSGVFFFGLRGEALARLQIIFGGRQFDAGGFDAVDVFTALLLGGFALGDIIGAFAGGALENLLGGLASFADGDQGSLFLVNRLDLAIELDAGFLHRPFGVGQYQACFFEFGFTAGKAGIPLFGDFAQFFEFALQRIELGIECEEAMSAQQHVELV